jgi:hypothetical protein
MVMAYRKEELSADDLAAFDLVIGYLKDTHQKSVNLRDLIFTGLNDAKAYNDAVKDANKARDDLKDRAKDATAILNELFEQIDPDKITLGQLNQNISLQQLIEIRQKLGR